MRLLIIAALLAAATFSADAQTLYRCMQKGKPTSYQNASCPDAAKTAAAVVYVPERNVPAPYLSPAPARPYYRRPARATAQHPCGDQPHRLRRGKAAPRVRAGHEQPGRQRGRAPDSQRCRGEGVQLMDARQGWNQ